ncbi:amidohydrolase [Treponema sp. OMZ 840]
MNYQSVINSVIKPYEQRIIEISDEIWKLAETKFEEYKSQKLYCSFLEELGFSVEMGIGNLPTAFRAKYGTQGPTIGFLGEFDALPNLDQKAFSIKKESSGGMTTNGHGCGHNLLGTGTLAAAIAIKEQIETKKIKGQVIYYGCPAEEGGSGKAWMVREHCFDDADVILTWHPYPHNMILGEVFLASIQAVFKFDGIAAHAAACPHLGRSALDAVELMNVGVNFLREHVIPEARIHYAIIDSGGKFANVVQPHAEVLYQLRAPKMKDVNDIYQRVQRIARGAALMTDTKVSVQFDRCCSEIRPNKVLNELLYEQMELAGICPIDERDISFANRIRSALKPEMIGTDERDLCKYYGEKGTVLAARLEKKAICDFLYPLNPISNACFGSTDVGDVSQIKPVGQISIVSYAKDTPAHSWQLVSQGKAPLAHKALLHAGKVLAGTAMKLLCEPMELDRVIKEFNASSSKEPYLWPIPKTAKPPIPKKNIKKV